MKESRFLTVYRYIEVDEDCDLDKMQELEKEFLALGDILGKHPYDASIRFRKLGRHHASGLYSPAYQCVCIDVRSPSSYVHEFLHMYDHFHGMLSEGYAFKEIRLQYEACLQEYLSDCEDPDLKARLNGCLLYTSGIAEATQALLSTIQLSVPQKCEYCRYTDVCHQQNTSALAPEKQPEETSIPVPAETVDLEKGLTPEQRRVVEHMDGPMAVLSLIHI